MTVDPENPTVRLCIQGMTAEAEDRDDDARALFQRAWDTADDDYEACVAAHYLARHQPTPEETLRWNQECLGRADAVGDDRVHGFYASLHLNLSQAYGALGEPAKARRHLTLAATRVRDVPEGPYGDWIRFAIADGLRTADGPAPRAADDTPAELVAGLCARADLRALGMILPPYLADLGTDDDLLRLVTALRTVHAARWLAGGEQDALSRAIASLAG